MIEILAAYSACDDKPSFLDANLSRMDQLALVLGRSVVLLTKTKRMAYVADCVDCDRLTPLSDIKEYLENCDK